MITQIIPCMTKMYAVYKNKDGRESRERILAFGLDPDMDESCMIVPMAFCSGLGINSLSANCCSELLRYELADESEEKETDALPVEFLLGQEPEAHHFTAALNAEAVCRSRHMKISHIFVYCGIIDVVLKGGTTIHFDYDLSGNVKQCSCTGGEL